MQRPPAYSAIKVEGRRAYDLARRGDEVEIKPRPVNVYRIEVVKYQFPLLDLTIDCGRGTYVRSIGRDLGEQLGTGAYLTQLRRTRVGGYTTQGAVTLESLRRETILETVRPAQ